MAKHMVDAETGEPIGFSRATWNAKEGRLDLKTDIIVAMGTGRLDLKKQQWPRAVGSTDAPFESAMSTTDTSLPSVFSPQNWGSHTAPTRHPLITQYLLEGPLNPRCHDRWDVRSDKIVVNDESELQDLAEEGVSFNIDLNDTPSSRDVSCGRVGYSSNVLLMLPSTESMEADDVTATSTADSAAPSPLQATASSSALSVNSSLPSRRVRTPNALIETDRQLGSTLG